VSDEVSVFGGHGCGGDSGGETESGVGQAIVGAADRADECGGCAQVGGGFGSGSAVTNGFAVGGESLSGSGFLLVEDFVKQDNLAGDFVAAEGLQFLEGVDGDDVGGESLCGSRGAAA
jgi:hypothetical protein